jgi:hypothetical protein
MARALAKQRGNDAERRSASNRAAGLSDARRLLREAPRLSGGAYQSILRRVDAFLEEPIAKAVKERERRGKKILKLDDAVSAAVEKLKAKGLTSPYLDVRSLARELHALLGDLVRFRRGARQDHRQRAEVQCRSHQTGRRRQSRAAEHQMRTKTALLIWRIGDLMTWARAWSAVTRERPMKKHAVPCNGGAARCCPSPSRFAHLRASALADRSAGQACPSRPFRPRRVRW